MPLLVLLLLAFVGLQGCVTGRPLSSSTTTNAFTPFQYSKFQKNFFVAWSESNVAAVDGGHTLQLSLNRKSGELQSEKHGTVSLSRSLVSVNVQLLGINQRIEFGAYQPKSRAWNSLSLLSLIWFMEFFLFVLFRLGPYNFDVLGSDQSEV